MANKHLFGRRAQCLSTESQSDRTLADLTAFLQGIKTKMSNLSTMARALSEHFSTDSTKPGILFSYLPGEDVYYCAVHRYFNSAGRQKQVIVSAKSVDPDTCVNDAAWQFLDYIGHPQTEVDRLRRAIKHGTGVLGEQ